MSEICFAEDAWNEYLYWQTQDRKTLKRINALLKEIQRTPFEGTGKPEALKNSGTGVVELMRKTALCTKCRIERL